MINNNEDRKANKEFFRSKPIQVCLTVAVMAVIAIAVYFLNIPNPNIFLISGQVIFTSLFGYISGAAAGVVMMIYSMFFFSTDHSFFTFTTVNLQKVCVTLIGAVVIVVFIGRLKSRNDKINKKLTEANLMLRHDYSRLEQTTFTDALTEIGNRNAFRRDFDEYGGGKLCIMMMDIDNFKSINDTYGHASGDVALKYTGRCLKDAFGESSCYRYGGDEFLVICQYVSIDEFNEKLDYFRRTASAFKTPDGAVEIRFSGGYVYGQVMFSSDLRSMLHRADEKLYEAKHGGKDTFVGEEYIKR